MWNLGVQCAVREGGARLRTTSFPGLFLFEKNSKRKSPGNKVGVRTSYFPHIKFPAPPIHPCFSRTLLSDSPFLFSTTWEISIFLLPTALIFPILILPAPDILFTLHCISVNLENTKITIIRPPSVYEEHKKALLPTTIESAPPPPPSSPRASVSVRCPFVQCRDLLLDVNSFLLLLQQSKFP